MPLETIRTLPFGTAVTLLRAARPIVTDLRAWTARKDADDLRKDRDGLERLLQGQLHLAIGLVQER
jgi:hypothetical protein